MTSADHCDNASASSAELSTADSGRGASEEGRDSHSPPPVIPPRTSLPPSAVRGQAQPPNRPPRRSSESRSESRQQPPSYNAHIRNSGRHSHRKIPCKVHHNQQQPKRPSSAMAFGDRPRTGYYGHPDTSSLQN